MSKIMTVLGEIKPDELGLTSMHEHILMKSGANIRDSYEKYIPDYIKVANDEPVTLENIGILRRNFILNRDGLSLDDEELMAAEVMDFKESGGSALLELSAIGLRYKLPSIKLISEKNPITCNRLHRFLY